MRRRYFQAMTSGASRPLAAAQSLEQVLIQSDFPVGCRMVVAVSGGPDSIALLFTLASINVTIAARWELLAVHINHQLRGEESAVDQHFVEELCRRIGVPCRALMVETVAHCAAHRLSVETGARELRYRALEEIRASWDGDVILTAHTADDQAETVIMRLLRGAGLTGLRGIAPRRGRVVRPFLGIRHEHIVRALQEWQEGYRVDSSNRDERHRRNRVRRVVLPALEREAPGVVAALGRTARLLQTDADYLERETDVAVEALGIERHDGVLKASVSVWRALHPSLQRSVLRRILSRSFEISDVSAETVDRLGAALHHPETTLVLPSAVMLVTTEREFQLCRRPAHVAATLVPGRLQIPGRLDIGVGVLTAEQISPTPDEFRRMVMVCGPFHAVCSATALGAELIVRARSDGDRIRPLGVNGSRKLQDVMVDRRVPQPKRESAPVVTNGHHLVWLPGLVLDNRVAARTAEDDLVLLSFCPLTRPLA